MPVHSPLTRRGRNCRRSSSLACNSRACSAPWLKRGQSDQARLADCHISWTGIATSCGKSWPPYVSGAEIPAPAAFDEGLVGLTEAVRHLDLAVQHGGPRLISGRVQRRQYIGCQFAGLIHDGAREVCRYLVTARQPGNIFYPGNRVQDKEHFIDWGPILRHWVSARTR